MYIKATNSSQKTCVWLDIFHCCYLFFLCMFEWIVCYLEPVVTLPRKKKCKVFFFSRRAQIFTCEDLVALIPKRKWLVSRECARAVWEHKHKMFKTMLNRKIFCDKSWSSQLAAATCFTLLFFCVHVKLKRDSFYSCKQFHTLADGEKKQAMFEIDLKHILFELHIFLHQKMVSTESWS